MKLGFLGGGAGIALLVWACGGKEVSIGHGAAGAGGSGGAASGGQGGTLVGGNGGTTSSGGTSSSGGSSTAGSTGNAGGAGGTGGQYEQLSSDKLDLLFVVDNSVSMDAHQAMLASSIGSFLRRLENPLCVEPNGAVASPQPDSPQEACPSGSAREFKPVRDMHVGVITSSLGARGGDICRDETDDDRAQLLPSVRPGLSSYESTGFLKWDPDGRATPPGEADIDALATDLSNMILAAGTNGCGYEHTLEAWYQFLIDPEPTTDIVQMNAIAVAQGTNADVLAQRAAFLRPDSAVAIVVLTNENDCSIIGGGQGWLVSTSTNGPALFAMPRATSACATDPNDPCCRSCKVFEVEPPAGCGPAASDPNCMINDGYLDNSPSVYEDQLNLRCYDHKRRFGVNLLYPIERYRTALTSALVPNRAGELVPNPLFGPQRNPSLISFALIAGVPWQDISPNPPGDQPTYLSAAELAAEGRWSLILGDPANGVLPGDPLLRETPLEREGLSPLVGASIVPSTSTDPSANPANGHEQVNVDNSDLQYSCIFELPQPIACSAPQCDCSQENQDRNRPLCNPPGGGPAGTTQYYAGAYPPLRQLELARALGEQSVLGSICPRNPTDDTQSDFGFAAEFNSLARRLGVMLIE